MTKKKFAAKRIPRRAVGQARWRWLLAIGVTAVVLFSAGYFVSHYQKEYVSRFLAWVAEHKNRFHHDKPKAVAMNKTEAEPPIHFEFYNTLPNMQVKNVITANVNANTNAKTQQPVTTPTLSNTPPPARASSSTIVDASELEKDFASQLKQTTISTKKGHKRAFNSATHLSEKNR